MSSLASSYFPVITSGDSDPMSMSFVAHVLIACLLAGVAAQRKGHLQKESHPTLIVHECTREHGCVPVQREVSMDANWRWIHEKNATSTCFENNEWSQSLCPDVATCASNCAIEGIARDSYEDTYGVSTDGDALRLDFVSKTGNVGSRLYLMDNATRYTAFQLKNREISFDVDVSTLPCGVNGAVYLVGMDADGGMQRFEGNEAGAEYGVGYCDAQCPRDVKFIDGEPNMLDWGPIPGVPMSGVGKYGSCCVEMDLWEANSVATAFTAHSCIPTTQRRCESAETCGEGELRYEGWCDKDGCDVQTYRLGAPSFYGPGDNFTVDTSRPFTVVTQFVTADGTDTGELMAIHRHYRQDGKHIPTPPIAVGHQPTVAADALSDEYCAAEAQTFPGNGTFAERGGMASMGAAAEEGMVLVLSLWDDAITHMRWLDSTSPPNSTAPGAKRGPCPVGAGDPQRIEPGSKAYAVYSRLRFGEINSTDATFPPAPPMPPSPPPPPACAKPYGQCGGKTPNGKNWTGPTCCPPGYQCQGSVWYEGCSPGTGWVGASAGGGAARATRFSQPASETRRSKLFG